MRNWPLAILVNVLPCLVATPGTASDSWKKSYNTKTGKRFIPVELWTGGRWNGTRKIRMNAASLVFGGGRKRITGPFGWKNPANGVRYVVYKRTNGPKTQYFALRGGIGIGRVYDSRHPRHCTPGFKFPIGEWRQGQSRTVRQTCWIGTDQSSRFLRTLTIKIEQIDFVHKGIPHSLRFRWTADNGGANKDNSYIYSPGRGMVGIIQH